VKPTHPHEFPEVLTVPTLRGDIWRPSILSGRTGSLRTRSSHTTVRTVPYTAVRSESYGDPGGYALVSLKEAVKSKFVKVAV